MVSSLSDISICPSASPAPSLEKEEKALEIVTRFVRFSFWAILVSLALSALSSQEKLISTYEKNVATNRAIRSELSGLKEEMEKNNQRIDALRLITIQILEITNTSLSTFTTASEETQQVGNALDNQLFKLAKTHQLMKQVGRLGRQAQEESESNMRDLKQQIDLVNEEIKSKEAQVVQFKSEMLSIGRNTESSAEKVSYERVERRW